ncbi:Phospholipase_D-nuclease N-terminal [Pustulibacterium marinum]|uniref:Phospholipase_D-nuclease N-terminal n=1 Tax=Pustulibacterium marinum TaxID=1224947 RepID=A0A1I7GAR7_9FLAO|nr:Phospholipase_D-nuclease N-terminal [Pustulibacterium marinum]
MMTRVIFLFIIFVFALPTLLALVDILKNKFISQRKVLWLLVVLLCYGMGALLYFAFGLKDKLPKETTKVNS